MISRNRETASPRAAHYSMMRGRHRIFAAACLTSRKIILILGVIAMTTSTFAPARMSTSAITAAGSLRSVAIESGAAPAELGGTYSKIVSAAVDDASDVAFSATLSDSSASSAILLKSADTTRVLLRAGDKAPDGSTYKKFDELDRSFYGYNGVDTAFMIFRAELEGGSASEGLFLMKPDEVQAVALAGEKSPRGFSYKSFSQPTLITEHSDRGLEWTLTFIGLMEEGNKSVITKSSIFSPEELTTGDKLGENEVKDFVISQMGAEAVCAVADLSDASGGDFKEVIFVGGNILSGTNFRTRGRIDGFGKIKQILTRPAMTFQVSIASVVFKGGLKAIAARDVLGGAFVIAGAGDTAPGLPNETIQGFDSPVSNGVFPFPFGAPRPPSGIVSAVKLSGGRSALWLWIRRVPALGPDIIETKLALIEGDTAPDGLVVHSFSPVKLSDKGTLLFSGTSGEGSTAHGGLFVLEGLFDGQTQ
jgi:hypothetical protein